MTPSHPGDFIRAEVIDELGLNVSRAAAILGVRRSTLSALLNGNASLSPEMALRIEKAFDVSMDMLLRMQAWHDASRMRARASEIARDRRRAVRTDPISISLSNAHTSPTLGMMRRRPWKELAQDWERAYVDAHSTSRARPGTYRRRYAGAGATCRRGRGRGGPASPARRRADGQAPNAPPRAGAFPAAAGRAVGDRRAARGSWRTTTRRPRPRETSGRPHR